MKKLVAVLLLLTCLFALSACKTAEIDDDNKGKIVYGEKYICAVDVSDSEEEQSYYIFEKDYLTYHYYYYYESYDDSVDTYSYTVTYKYEAIDEETIAFFFDSVDEIDGLDTAEEEELKERLNDKNGILIVSKNVLMSQGGTLYVRESYIEDELTNFDKE